MSAPRHDFVDLLGHEIHVTLWGDASATPIVMWHGLARTGRDFDELACAMARDHFVICPDTFGRGLSSWAGEPTEAYSVAHMAQMAEALLDHFGLGSVGWLGTSMGGLIGMRLASDARSERLSYLILNDIGPEVPQTAIDRILAYAGDLPVFDSVAEAAHWLRSVYAPFGQAPDVYWRRMAMTSLRRKGDGSLTLHYDPRIIQQFDHHAGELTSWERYEAIKLPMHVIAGEDSDILTPDIRTRMQGLGPRPEITLYDGCGHAPALARPEDAKRVARIIAQLTARAG